ncbi:MAG: acetyl-CoA carboxylase biotin carboxylase subunit [Acidobacteria bacterium]|nr:MAG: acetyl-CoA carboxylase biotin carboxylase subunit [Acidobacteriota bacterium]
MFKKILIANRGEIAVRVIRACRELGILSVAIYSDADRAALHVLKADEAYYVGPTPASESYLNIEHIIATARNCGAEAIHPGYGFLSENAEFARACARAGIKFIGPPAEAIEIMGLKTRARQQMEKAGVPFVPGTSRGVESIDEAREVAAQLGYPVMLKAAAGGGGKGMRLVESAAGMASALEAAQSEAQRAFGSNEVYLEKAITNPRHIEIQVLADEHGHCVHLGERECSIQRRHQKVLEESPSPAVSATMRQSMGEIAVKAAKAVGYTNAGTIEFLADASSNFYFLEMNTRLQVEHPVTELVCGVDLVHLQIGIAAGERLPFSQPDIQPRGHAIECRIYAEDENYFPSPGQITALSEPAGPGIRLDSGIYQEWTVPVAYDPLLAKLIRYGGNRPQAIGRLRRAIDECFIGGIKTNLQLFGRILSDPAFAAGDTDTGYLERLSKLGTPADESDQEAAAIAAALFASIEPRKNGPGTSPANASSGWKRAARTESLG